MATDLLAEFIDNHDVSKELWEKTVKACTQPGHRTLVTGNYVEGAKCLRKCYQKTGHERLHAVKCYVEYPAQSVKPTHTVHAVLAYDHRSDGKSRGAEIVGGGVGQQHIKVEVESKPGLKGLEFTVIIIGK